MRIELERITPLAPTRPNEKVTVLWHHAHVAWRADKIAIVESPAEHWHVNDIRVHGRSQFASVPHAIWGIVFGPTAQPGYLALETVQTRMTFEIDATYTGPNPDGEVFDVEVFGMVAP